LSGNGDKLDVDLGREIQVRSKRPEVPFFEAIFISRKDKGGRSHLFFSFPVTNLSGRGKYLLLGCFQYQC
jgi:hypothetical protein